MSSASSAPSAHRAINTSKTSKKVKKAAKPLIPLANYGPSSLPKKDLDNFKAQLGDTLGFSLVIPEEHERPLNPRVGGKIFWFDQLIAGLRFPIPPFFDRLSRLYEIPLNQLNPASFRRAIFFHMILSLEDVEDTATLFFKCHYVRKKFYHLYFSPMTWFAPFYEKNVSLDKSWHSRYLVAFRLDNEPWALHPVPLRPIPSSELNPPVTPKLTANESHLLNKLLLSYGKDHTLLKTLVESEEALSFFGLKPGTPWIPSMGMDFNKDLGERAKQHIKLRAKALRAKRDSASSHNNVSPIIEQVPANKQIPAIEQIPCFGSLKEQVPSKGQIPSNNQRSLEEQTPHPLAEEVNRALPSSPTASNVLLLEASPDFRAELAAVSFNPDSSAVPSKSSTLSRKRNLPQSPSPPKRGKFDAFAPGAELPNDCSILFAPAQLPLGKLSPSTSVLGNPFQPIQIPKAPKKTPSGPTSHHLITNLRDQGLECPNASYSSANISVSFPGRLCDAQSSVSSTLLASLLRAEDWQELDRYSTVDLEHRAATYDLKAIGCRAMLSHKAQLCDVMKIQTEDLSRKVKRLMNENENLQQRDKEREELSRSNVALLERAEQEKKSLSDRIRELEEAHRSSSSRLESAEKDHKLALEQISKSSFKKGQDLGIKEGIRRGKVLGAYMCKSYLLMTPAGQSFLNILVRGLQEAFIHSPHFSKRMMEPLLHWISTIVEECSTQLQMEDVDTETILNLLREDTPTLELNPRLSPTNPWYQECLRQAACALSFINLESEPFPPWEMVPYVVLPPDAGKFELLRSFFYEIKKIYPCIQQEIRKAEREALHAYYHRVAKSSPPNLALDAMVSSFDSCPPSLAEEAPPCFAEEARPLSFASYLQSLIKKPSPPSAVAIASSQHPQDQQEPEAPPVAPPHQEPEAPPRQESAPDPESHQEPAPS